MEEKGSGRAVDFEAAVLRVDPALLLVLWSLRREEERVGVFSKEETLLLVDEVRVRFVRSASGFLLLLLLLLLVISASIDSQLFVAAASRRGEWWL